LTNFCQYAKLKELLDSRRCGQDRFQGEFAPVMADRLQRDFPEKMKICG
jgi:hypothetical protein